MTNNELKELALSILDEAFVISLGTVDGGGVWVSDVTFVRGDNLELYWTSAPNTRHSCAIELNPQVACTVTASCTPHNEKALQIAGTAKRIDGSLFDLEKKLKQKTGGKAPESPGEILQKGFVWYMLKPTKIELHHSIYFGKERQTLNL